MTIIILLRRRRQQKNLLLLRRIPKDDFDRMIAACDAGLIFLDNRFTIPNYPSRLLSYMQAGLPVLACTDAASDVGQTVEDGGFGVRMSAGDARAFPEAVRKTAEILGTDYRERELAYLKERFSVETAVSIITNGLENCDGD